MATTVEVGVGADHLDRLIRTPVAGVMELVWNALDADAQNVRVQLNTDELGGLQSVQVFDDGHGMTVADVARAFSAVGDSWKRVPGATTPGGRFVHGKQGQGRFAAFGVGEGVTWRSVALDGEVFQVVHIRGKRSDLKHFEVDDPYTTTETSGTDVTITQLAPAAARLLTRQEARTRLLTGLALYLQQYPQVQVSWQDVALSPSSVQTSVKHLDVRTPEGEEGAAQLTVIEWSLAVERRLYLCDVDGTSLWDLAPGIQAPGFHFTAYVRWAGFRGRAHDALLSELGGGGAVGEVVEAAKEQLRSYFKQRAETRQREILDGWQREKTYPYKGEPRTEVERVERQTFDLVALVAAEAVQQSQVPARALSLRLIKEALEASPQSLHRVLAEVLDLSDQSIEDLREMLDRTKLSSIIGASRVIGDRLDFLALLDAIIWEKEAKAATLERDQLHRLLERNTWVFGEEWAITTSDHRLTAVLKEHLALLGEDILPADAEPALMPDGRQGRPDLVLWQAAEVHQNRAEHLVVELKRPSLKLTFKEVQQIEEYAHAVIDDGRFNTYTVKWDFWLIGDKVDNYVQRRRTESGRERGVIAQNDSYTIRVKLWAEVLADALHRHKFVQKALDFETGRDLGVARMQVKYNKYLPPVLRANAVEEDAPIFGIEAGASIHTPLHNTEQNPPQGGASETVEH